MSNLHMNAPQPWSVGRTVIPLRMEVGGEHVDVGDVELEVDIRDLHIDEKGQIYALLDLRPEG